MTIMAGTALSSWLRGDAPSASSFSISSASPRQPQTNPQPWIGSQVLASQDSCSRQAAPAAPHKQKFWNDTRLVFGQDTAPRLATAPLQPCGISLSMCQLKFRLPETENKLPIKVQNNELQVIGVKDEAWLDLIPFAEDVQAENVRLSFCGEVLSSPTERIELKASNLSSGIFSPWNTGLIPPSEPALKVTHATPNKQVLKLVVSKTIPEGGIPRLWFSSEVAAQLGLPFLNFSHIRGKEYVCPLCKSSFTAPNPLKLHIATDCDSLESKSLWSRTFHEAHGPRISPWSLPLLFSVPHSSASPALPVSAVTSVSPAADIKEVSSPTGASAEQISRNATVVEFKPTRRKMDESNEKSTHKSAFRRVETSKISISRAVEQSSTIPGSIETSRISLLSQRYHTPGFQPVSNVFRLLNDRSLVGHSRDDEGSNHNLLDPCAEVEALVSNLGRGRGGHVCLYCGKMYSRKYGLKIHIRTHTGYKPLSCRVCHRAFGDPSNLNKHVRLHAQGSTPYRCRHCGKVLVRRRDLARHLVSRHPDKPTLDDDQHSDEGATSTEGEDVEVENIDS